MNVANEVFTGLNVVYKRTQLKVSKVILYQGTRTVIERCDQTKHLSHTLSVTRLLFNGLHQCVHGLCFILCVE